MASGYRVKEFGGPEVMIWEPLNLGELAPDAVRVRVGASGINFAETRMRAGDYSGQELPFIMGMEVAGSVEQVGREVADFKVGDRVFGRVRGAHAEVVDCDPAHLMPLPDNLSYAQGAAIPVGWLTAWHALYTVGRMAPGDRVLVEAVGGSVGSAALALAKQAGCWTLGTASRNDKLACATGLGCDAVVNYTCESVSERVASLTNGEGMDIGLMTIGDATAHELIDSMGMDGRVVMFGSTGGRDITFNLRIGILNIQLLSMSISTSPAFMTRTMPDFRDCALPLFASGDLIPVVDTVLPMSELVRAHTMVDERAHFGKVILVNDEQCDQPSGDD
jgi:NADPH:quinone reductase-like Zn-dependent oxidoreductase